MSFSIKIPLFSGLFGSSDEVLGSIEAGVDFEKRIAAIYQNCKTRSKSRNNLIFFRRNSPNVSMRK